MHVVALEARQVRIPLYRAIQHATQFRTESDNLVVRCQLSDGTVGWGEGVPRDYVTGETIDTCFDLLQRSDLGSQFESVDSFERAAAVAERLRLAPVPGDDRGCQGNAARCAVELAVLDAYGRALGEPLMNVTRLLTPKLYAPRPEVRYGAAITKARRWKARVYPLVIRLLGFTQLKVKVGIPGVDDVTRTRVIRRWAGPMIDLRLDANEAWTPAEAAARIRQLEGFRITSVEQPVPHAEVASLAEVRKQVSTPIMLDESLCSMTDAERAAAGGWCDLFNLRLSKCGGFIPTLRLAEFAAANGLGCQLGCQVGETGILSAAGRHFATSVGGLKYLEGSYDRHLVRNWLTAEDITFARGGVAPALVGVGLGVTVDTDKVDAATVRREVLFGGA
jgi:muconate cycloisomerase